MSDETVTVYRCTECDKVSASLGHLHAHIDAKHHGFGPFNLLANPFKLGDYERCMEKTETLTWTDGDSQ